MDRRMGGWVGGWVTFRRVGEEELTQAAKG